MVALAGDINVSDATVVCNATWPKASLLGDHVQCCYSGDLQNGTPLLSDPVTPPAAIQNVSTCDCTYSHCIHSGDN